MQRTTCFLILDQLDYLTNTQKLVGEHFPEVTFQQSNSVDEMLASIGSPDHVFSYEHSSRILITDSPAVVDDVNYSGTYIPTVMLDRGDSNASSAQFAPSQVADLCNGSQVYDAISEAIELSKKYNKLQSQASKLETLAERERKIIALAAEGVPNKTIAVRLGVSIKTVEKNRRIAYSKLSVSSTAEMASLVTFSRFFSSFAQ